MSDPLEQTEQVDASESVQETEKVNLRDRLYQNLRQKAENNFDLGTAENTIETHYRAFSMSVIEILNRGDIKAVRSNNDRGESNFTAEFLDARVTYNHRLIQPNQPMSHKEEIVTLVVPAGDGRKLSYEWKRSTVEPVGGRSLSVSVEGTSIVREIDPEFAKQELIKTPDRIQKAISPVGLRQSETI